MVDYHTHTRLCKHGEGEVEEYVLKAIERGLDEIGCSEHMPMPDEFDLRHRMSLEEYYSIYAPAVSGVAERYKDRITVRRGLEAEFLPGYERWIENFIKENDFDYVIGSVHFLGTKGNVKPLFHVEYSEEAIEELHVEYFEAIRQSAFCRQYDIIGHCDLIKKFGVRSSKRIEEARWEALKAIKEADVCVEINTSGWRKPEQDTYPGIDVLELVHKLRIPLTLGSDAHKPEQVAMGYERVGELLDRFGSGRYSVFQKRQRSELTLLKSTTAC